MRKTCSTFTFDGCGDTNSVEQLVLSVNPQAQVFSSSLPISFLKNAEQLKQLEEKTSDFAILVFNANETRISLEENTSIGYGVFYKLLQRITNNRVLIVLTGDDSFDKSPHPTLPVLSAPVYSNFFAGEHHVIPMEYFNGTKSFVFSWGKRHSAVHVLALEHFLNATGESFKYEAPKPASRSVAASSEQIRRQKASTTSSNYHPKASKKSKMRAQLCEKLHGLLGAFQPQKLNSHFTELLKQLATIQTDTRTLASEEKFLSSLTSSLSDISSQLLYGNSEEAAMSNDNINFNGTSLSCPTHEDPAVSDIMESELQ